MGGGKGDTDVAYAKGGSVASARQVGGKGDGDAVYGKGSSASSARRDRIEGSSSTSRAIERDVRVNGAGDESGVRETSDRVAGSRFDNIPLRAARSEVEQEYWTKKCVEKVAQMGFEMRRRNGGRCDFKISMGGKSHPAMTEAGMDRYCAWLCNRVKAVSEEHSSDVLKGCRTMIDFSHSGLNNQMVWKLLQTLLELEVNPVMLKLFGNCISKGGVLAICEFIRASKDAEPLYELHLSHNEICDEVALELLKTIHEHRPQYPPRRVVDKSGKLVPVPVWVQMNQNKVLNPKLVLQEAKDGGVTICEAWDRNACSTGWCCSRGNCPLVHMYSFHKQLK